MKLSPYYLIAEPTLVTGTTIAFWGSGWSPIYILSWLIERLTGGGPSHIAFVVNDTPDGKVDPVKGPRIVQCTIDKDTEGKTINGVQYSWLRDVLAKESDQSRIAALYLSDATKKRANWSMLDTVLSVIVGKVTYSVRGLFEELLPYAWRASEPPNPKEMFCSACWAFICLRIGMLDPVINYSDVMPVQVIQMDLYDGWASLTDAPPKLVGFNSL
jgi:hypothetical protein